MSMNPTCRLQSRNTHHYVTDRAGISKTSSTTSFPKNKEKQSEPEVWTPRCHLPATHSTEVHSGENYPSFTEGVSFLPPQGGGEPAQAKE